jgi:hypothetical protein
MPNKVVLMFSDKGGYGWSETHWYNGPTDTTSVFNNVTALVNARLTILPKDVALLRARITGPLSRDPQIIDFTEVGIPNGQYPVNSIPDWVAIQVRIDNPAVGYNRIFMRTVPSDCVTEDSYTPASGFSLAFNNNFRNYLVANNIWQIRSKLANPTTYSPIANLTPVIPKGMQFTGPVGIAAVGDTIRIKGARLPFYNGIKVVTQVLALTPTVYYCGGATPPVADPTPSSPQAGKLIYSFAQIATITDEDITRRAPGRFFGQRRGRRATYIPLRQ